MRIRRIRLSNFEGVTASEVTLAATGMTIIEGPNEVGKSSLVRGVDLLFQFPHESRHNRVLATCPVHTDAGPEVEVELSTGSYHVVYSKRWHKKPDTTLAILAPYHESLTGRQAHDRMKAILDETLDEPLYQALRYIQGSQIGQGSVGSSTTLIGALDRAAAGGSADPDAESTLWEAVDAERLRYVTPSGKLSREREQLQIAASQAKASLATFDQAIEELESTGDSYRQTVAMLASNNARHVEALEKLGAARREQTRIGELEATVAAIKTQAEMATLKETEARRHSEDRSELVLSIEEAEVECRTLARTQADAEGRTVRAREWLDTATGELADTEIELEGAASTLRRAAADLDYYRSVNADRLYTSRLNGLSEARALEVSATGVLDACRVTTAERRQVETAWSQLRDAQIALTVGSPTVTVTALRPAEVNIDGTTVDLATDEIHALTVTGSTVIAIPNHLSLAVTVGTSGDDLRLQVDTATRELSQIVEQLGLDSTNPMADLTEQSGRRSQAERDLEHARRIRADALVDLTEAELAAKAAGARSTVAEYPVGRQGWEPLPPSAEMAEDVFDQAQRAREGAEKILKDARQVVEAAQSAVGDARTVEATTNEALRGKAAALLVARTRLAKSRSASSDADLVARLLDARSAAQSVLATQEKAVQELEANDPRSTQLRLSNAEALVERIDRESRTIDEERVRLKTLMETRGAEDLQGQREDAASLEAELSRQHEDMEQRAGAALLLYQLFLRHRDKARLAYVVPYRQQIEALARLVFGQDVRIDVDPGDLSLVSRTLAGRTVPFESLSTGTKEQLAVLARLACAILVNPGGDDADAGVPVILDDALGNTDPERLRALAPAFSDAATRTQVIALASSPDRYGTVGNATILRIALDRQGSASRPTADSSN